MQQLFQSAFLQALGKAIADSIWQMGLLFLVYQLLVFLFRIQRASIKNLISTVFVLSGFVWFLSNTILHWQSQLQQKTSLVINDVSVGNSMLGNFTKDNRWELLFNWMDYKLQFILPYLSVAYLFVMLWFATKLVVQLQATYSLRNKGITTVSDDLQHFFSFLVRSMAIPKDVQLFISTGIDIPATLGFLKPIVLLPAAAVTHLTAAQLEAVLLHELAHIKRNDYFWNLLLSVAETMLFFNPFALLLIGVARREREHSCDDHVMNYQQNAAVYAEALLNVEKSRMKHPQLVMALGDNKHHLLDRVKRILNIPAEKNKISTRLLALLFFTVLFALTGWIIKEAKPSPVKELVLTTPVTSEKNNTLFFNADQVVQKNNLAVSLRDDKRKMRVELKQLVKKDELIVWNEEMEREMKFDKVIFDDVPSEWIERFIQPGVRMLSSVDLKRSATTPLYRDYDSTAFVYTTEGDIFYRNFEIEQKEQPKKRTASTRINGNPYLRLQKNWNKDSLMQKMNGQFLGNFSFNGEFPVEMFQQFPQLEQFYVQRHKAAAEVRAENLKAKAPKNRYAFSFRSKSDTTDNARLKNREKESPVLAYLYGQPRLREDLQIAQEQIQIIVENNHIRMMQGNQEPCSCPDSLQVQTHTPPPPKRIKRLEIIRL
jgi:beta-lactamase regulating signal transducer with metallopeptidase domain